MRTVAICVITYKRPARLSCLLESIRELRPPEEADVVRKIVVVDNDTDQSARLVVERAASHSPWPVRYEVEQQRGISFARNRGVTLAGDCDYIAFVDDDEVVDPGWIQQLLSAQKRFNADVVAGAVIPVFDLPPPSWVVQGDLFTRLQYPTGTRNRYVGCGNVLLRTRILHGVEGPFDPRFALSGGEDTFLFMQLIRAGRVFVWCDEAMIKESVPASRVTFAWILRRSYRGGNTTALCELLLEPTTKRAAVRFTKASIRIVLGLFALIPGVFQGRGIVARRLAYSAAGFGMITGIFGRRLEEYRSVSEAENTVAL